MREKVLLPPLMKLIQIAEESGDKINAVIDSVEMLVEASKESNDIQIDQTDILLDIKTGISTLVSQTEAKKSKGFSLPGIKAGVGFGGFLVLAAAGIAGASFFFNQVYEVSPNQLITAIAISLALVPMVRTVIDLVLELSPVRSLGESAGFALLNKISPATITQGGAMSKKDAMSTVFKTVIAASVLIVIASFILQAVQPISVAQIAMAFLIGFSLAPMAGTFTAVLVALEKAGVDPDKMGLKKIGIAGAAMIMIAISIAGIALALKLLPKEFQEPPEIMWVLQTGFMLYVFSIPLKRILKATRGLNGKQLAFAAVAIPLLALSIVGVSYALQLLSDGNTWIAPPTDWTLKTGLALLLFSIPFVTIARALQKAGSKALLTGALAVPLIALTILATAWIFQIMPEEYKSPPISWALSSGLAIALFAIPFAVVGLLGQALTPVGLLLGAAGMILIAGTMWVVAWIFSKMPDLSAISKNITDALMYPVNAMIDALARFKNEIGIENLLPLAGGLLAIAGSWLALTAALAGQAAGGLVSSVANLGSTIIDGIGSLFGGEKTKSPIDLLDMLIDRQAGIQALANPVKILGDNFANMSQYTEAVITGVTAFSPFLDEDNADNFTKSADAATTLALAYEKMSNASQTMNVMAISESARMFEALARIAEADGEDAITAISEKLMEAVKQLSETVENLQEANDQNSTSIQDTISSTIGGFIDKIKGTTDSAGQSESGLVDVAPIVAAIQELEDRLNRPIRVEEI